EDLVSLARFVAFGAARFAGRRALGDPHVALVIDEEAVRPVEETRAEALDQIAVQVELQDRIDFRVEAGVSVAFTRAQHPEMLAVRVHIDAGDDAELPSCRQLLPSVD